jgi:hemerythrin-like domain-containing protein
MRLLRVCTALENIADGLPGSGSQERTAKVLGFLDKAFARHLFIYEKCLFPMIRSLEEKNEPVELVLQELEFEHAADQGLIVEIASAFMGRCERNGERNTEMLGYLLRAFFENCRRHCAWERNIVQPIVRRRLVSGTPRKQHDALLFMSVGLDEKVAKETVLC